MAGLTAAAQGLLLLAQTGDTPDGALAGQLAAFFAAEGVTDPTTQAATADQVFAVQLRLLDGLLAYWRDAMSRVLTEDERETLKLRLSSLEAARAAVVSARATAITQSTAAGTPVSGTLTTTAPVRTPWGYGPDANDRAYSGDPYRRRGGGR